MKKSGTQTKSGNRKNQDGGQERRFSLLSEDDLFLFNEGTHRETYNHLGAHCVEVDGAKGVHFSVWAPNAREVSVIGDFNGWDNLANPMRPRADSGIWETFIEGLEPGVLYKYFIRSSRNGYCVRKADPCGYYAEVPPRTASVVWDLGYEWEDGEWKIGRAHV